VSPSENVCCVAGKVGVCSDLFGSSVSGYSQHGNIKCPEGVCSSWKVLVPGLNPMCVSPGPVKLNCKVVKSRMALWSMSVLSPRRAGVGCSEPRSFTIGV